MQWSRCRRNPGDKAAEAIVSKDRSYHSMLRTTCVATLLEGGHANNALPQRAAANINCRIFPGETLEGTQAALAAAIGDPGVKITPVPPIRPIAVPPPLDANILGPAEKLVAKYFPACADSVDVDRRNRRHISRGDRHSRIRRAGRLG